MSTRYNTGNPIESTDVRDMSDNAKNLDLFSNSSELSFDDRLGIERKTIHGMNSEFDGMIVGMNSEFDAKILNMGFTRVGTFLSGATLTNPRQTLLWDTADGGDGQEYGWSGTFPKIVPPSSTPSSTGGIAVGAWMSRFDPALRVQTREALRRSYAEAGYNLVDGSFEAGGTLVNTNDVLLQERTGKGFTGPAGAVSAGTVPSGPNYTNRGDGTLRSDLANPNMGAAMVARGVVTVDSMQELLDLPTSMKKGDLTYLVKSFLGGDGIGGGDFFWDADKAGINEGDVFSGFVELKKDIRPIEAYGGGEGVLDNGPAFLRSARAQGAVTFAKKGGAYAFPSEVNIDVPVDVFGNDVILKVGGSVARSDTFIFNLGCTSFRIRGVGGVEIQSPLVSNGRVHDIITSFKGKSGTFVFPQGPDLTSHMPKVVEIIGNDFGSARVSVGNAESAAIADDATFTFKSNIQVTSEKVYTYLLYAVDVINPNISGNKFAGDMVMIDPAFSDNCDAVKINGQRTKNAHFTGNSIEGFSDETPVQVDIFSGGYGAKITGNSFINAHLHRKCTAIGGVVPLIDLDVILGNSFEITKSLTGLYVSPFYYVGQGGIIACNQVRIKNLTFNPGQFVRGLHFDDNGAHPTIQGGQYSSPNKLIVLGNSIDLSGITGATEVVCMAFEPAVGGSVQAPVYESPVVVANVLRGGDRAWSGEVGISLGNQWVTERPTVWQTRAGCLVGNYFPASSTTSGRTDSTARDFLPLTGSVVDVSRTNYIRANGGTITSLTGGVAGQQVTIYARTGPVTVEHGNAIRLKGEVNASIPGRSTLTLLRVPDQDASGGEWQEIGRGF